VARDNERLKRSVALVAENAALLEYTGALGTSPLPPLSIHNEEDEEDEEEEEKIFPANTGAQEAAPPLAGEAPQLVVSVADARSVLEARVQELSAQLRAHPGPSVLLPVEPEPSAGANTTNPDLQDSLEAHSRDIKELLGSVSIFEGRPS
jgi:hypothetical protein